MRTARKTSAPTHAATKRRGRPRKTPLTPHPTASVVAPVQRKRPGFTYAVGRRKTAVARVRHYPGQESTITINGMPHTTYFPEFELSELVVSPLKTVGQQQWGVLSASVAGGGKRGQAEAVKLGISRVLVAEHAEVKPTLKKAGFLKRDTRIKERKKYGLKRARRAPQWQKR